MASGRKPRVAPSQSPRHPRMTSRPGQMLEGGGTQSGSLDLPQEGAPRPRVEIQEMREDAAAQSVGESLLTRMKSATDQQVQEFTDILATARMEADRGDPRALRTYGYALNQLAQDDPAKWYDFFTASGLTGDQWRSYFHPADEAAVPDAPVAAAPTLGDVENFEQAMPLSPAGGTIDLETLLAGFGPPRPAREGGELAAQATPFAPAEQATRADFPWRLSQFLTSQRDLEGNPRMEGGRIATPSQIAEQFYYDDRPAKDSRALYPEMESVANIQMLRQLSGLPFTPGLPAMSSSVGRLDRGSPLQAMEVRRRVATAAQKAPSRIRELLALAEQANSDPAIAAAIENNESVFLPRQTRDGDTKLVPTKVNPTGLSLDRWQQAVMGQASRLTNPGVAVARPGEFVGTVRAPMFANNDEAVAAARRLISEATEFSPQSQALAFREGVDPAAVQSAVAGLLDGYEGSAILAPQGAFPAQALAADRQILNASRSPLQKNAEAIEAVLSGAEANLDLDRLAPYWRNEDFIAPDSSDGGLYRGQLPPDILATLIAQQVGRNDPRYIAMLVPHVARSMEALSGTRAPRPSRTSQYAPPTFEPTRSWLDGVQKFYQRRGQPMPQLQQRGVPAPANPATPDMTDTSMLPSTPRFAQYRNNPLTSLVG